MNKPYSASAYQVCIGYKYLRGENLPGNLPFDQAAHDLSNDFGFDRVRAILTGIPNYRAACTPPRQTPWPPPRMPIRAHRP